MASPLSILMLLAFSGPAQQAPPDPRVEAVSPFVGAEVVALAHVDLTRLRVAPLARTLLGDAGADMPEPMIGAADAWVAGLRKAGARDLFVLVDPADIPGMPVAVVPLPEGADARAIGRLLCGRGGERAKPPLAWPTCATIRGAVFAGTEAALERARGARPAPRPELAAAFAATPDAAARILLLPNAEHRRLLEEMLPTLPRELGGGPITAVTHGVVWATVALVAEPKPVAKVVVKSQGPDAARALARVAQDALKLFGQAVRKARPEDPDLARDLGRLKAEAVEDRLVLDVDLAQAVSLVSVPYRAATEASRRTACVNNLLQIGLAFHNYYAVHNAFPPAFSRDKQGRPLLSWRVHLLPFLDQQALYKEFHLEESWDSSHNRALIERMPPVYACPGARRTVRAAGKTSYLTPRGKATVFPGAEAIKINEITDGTSNTISVVDANDDAAVVWTKPDDWDVDPAPRTRALFGHHPRGTQFGFADGSVRFLRETVDPKVLRALTTRDGGEVIGSDQF